MSDTNAEEKIETSTEFLIRMMERFSVDEPVDMIITYVTRSEKTWCETNHVEFYRAVAMLECAKQALIKWGDQGEDGDE